ncbi:unnamed protein product [Phyllotreta striolata]|uniref:Tetratricopeptide repeat protein 37 n=1 Tax=Phyllotreta striolata TaxID=444603 RepID=A0A9N9TP00_PHYSR|nr:unnamed protein product [Phyllotreta striolata]
MKDTKTLLKEAREAIKSKDYNLTLKISKTILKQDKTNYMALVFLGLALQEVGPVEQASKAFQKAIDLTPSNPLAWNGLVNYYEKLNTEESKDKLVELYISALEVETNPKKMIEYCEKLSELHERGDVSKITATIFNCANRAEGCSGQVYEVLAKLYEKLKQVPSDLQPIYEESFQKLLGIREFMKVEYFSAYLNVLYQQNKYLEVFENAEKMSMVFERDTVSLTWMCKIYNQSFVEESNLHANFSEKIADYLPKLQKLDPKNVAGLFSKSIQLLLENDLTETKNILKEVCALRPGLIHAWVLLTSTYLKLHQFQDALQTCKYANKLLNSGKYTNAILQKIIDNLYLQLLAKSSNKDDWNEAIDIYLNIKDKSTRENNLEHVICIYIKMEEFTEASALLKELEMIDQNKAIFLQAKLLQTQNNYRESLDLLERNFQETSEWLCEIGTNYWHLEDLKNALTHFLKAAKCDANNYICFFHLGNYYQKIGDFDKARRCYEKAYSLNKSSREVAIELSKMYSKSRNWEAAQNLLLNLTEGPINETNSWAWLQLGLSYLEQEEYSKAIEKLQFVVRVEKENTYYWQCLADAYFARGSYISALKCYEKSTEYTENTLYPSLQIANIKHTLRIYDEARCEFMEILSKNERYIPALKGLAETSLNQAWECYRAQRLGTARDHAQSAIDNLIVAVKERNNFSCLWKLIGDTCLFVTNLPEKHRHLSITEALMEGKSTIRTEDLFSLSASCYCRAISLTSDNILIWHDLSNCYLKHALHLTDKEKRNTLFTYASAAATNCSETNPNNWQHWNLLGNISMYQDNPNFALAQHYFIKAVTVENNNPISWCNLGVLYLMMDDIKLANKAFAQGQRSDPNFVNNWIGQALIAETLGVEEAMDLFRHSVQLSHHQQGALGYGHWVCQTLLDAPQKTISYSIEGMHAVPVACDALEWFTEIEEDNSCAWNMLGILKERLKQNKGSLEAFKNAYKLKTNCDLVRVNYGRLLYKQNEYIGAIKTFQEVQAATFSSGSGLALSLFKNHNYEESYAAYEQALHWLTEEQSHQSELLVALASMAYMFQGSEGAKTLLFQSIQLKPPSPWGLYATLALGLIHQDMELAELVLKELERFKDDQRCLSHYAILLGTMLLRQEKPDKAIRELSKLVHRHPNNSEVWLTLAVTMLRVKSERKRAVTAVKCAQIALESGKTKMDVTKNLSYVSLGYLLAGDAKRALVSAQKAIFCYPNLADGWALLSAILVQTKIKSHDDFMRKIFKYIYDLNPTELLMNWLKRLQKSLNQI